jgi:glycoprotein 3-alpha-L-fucosyltransferase
MVSFFKFSLSTQPHRSPDHPARSSILQELDQVVRINYAGEYRHNTNFSCPKRQAGHDNSFCFRDLSKDYVFYLALENSDCKDYVTEKVFRNSFEAGLIPIV